MLNYHSSIQLMCACHCLQIICKECRTYWPVIQSCINLLFTKNVPGLYQNFFPLASNHNPRMHLYFSLSRYSYKCPLKLVICWIIFQRITKVQLPVDIIEMIIIFIVKDIKMKDLCKGMCFLGKDHIVQGYCKHTWLTHRHSIWLKKYDPGQTKRREIYWQQIWFDFDHWPSLKYYQGGVKGR